MVVIVEEEQYLCDQNLKFCVDKNFNLISPNERLEARPPKLELQS